MKLYNTLTKTKETFHSFKPHHVTLYVCGITPYDTTHLGHAFTYTVFDVLYRFLEFQKYSVNYTQNVTDIDDDILKKAKENHRHSRKSGNPVLSDDWKELGTYWTNKYLNDMKALNNIPPTHYVKATETIPTIIEIIEKLIADGYAYEKNGNVYFDVQKGSDYGKLSDYSREEMIQFSRERGANPDDPNKKNPLDFILWQKSKKNEPFWDPKKINKTKLSCLPAGRPGWHIECSAMVYKYLGKKIDIHGGGADLIYPHHESEIAQSEQFTQEKPFSQFWMHIGMVRYQGEKMSKSLGNLIMVSDLLKTYSPDAIRYLLLSHHYRDPWEYHEEDMKNAQREMDAIKVKLTSEKKKKNGKENRALNEFSEALSNDLDTPKALTILNQTVQKRSIEEAKRMMDILGFTV